MLSPTVNIFLVVITKGGKCCLNCFIILYTNICPKVLSTPIIAICITNLLCQNKNEMMSTIQRRAQEQRMETIATHLLIQVIIYIGCGLYSDFIYAWKSGKNPSAKRETIRSTIPMNSVCFSDFLDDSGSNILNIIIPAVMMIPTTIFFVANLSFLSLTLEQRTPTKMTEMRLQDLNIITTGKLVRQIAQVQVRVEMETVTAHMADFLAGM